MSKKSRDLNTWVLENLQEDIIPLGKDFCDWFKEYLFNKWISKTPQNMPKMALRSLPGVKSDFTRSKPPLYSE